jgi:hypothetical protein
MLNKEFLKAGKSSQNKSKPLLAIAKEKLDSLHVGVNPMWPILPQRMLTVFNWETPA